MTQLNPHPSKTIPNDHDARRLVSAGESGYASPEYARALSEFGKVVSLPAAGGSLLVRCVPRCDIPDATGPYPLFSCHDWGGLDHDIRDLEDNVVAVSLVVDPFAEVRLPDLQSAFPDVCYAYKEHFAVDLSRDPNERTSSAHRRNIRKAFQKVEVRSVSPSGELLANWMKLYDHLILRHSIEGIARFSAASFAQQMNVPGFVAYAAYEGDQLCGMVLWYVRQGVAYYHLAAYSDRGYELGASFAIFATALREFAEWGLNWAALGAGAGTVAIDSGLTRFKQGWSTETRPAYFCGRILQPEIYRMLVGSSSTSSYFPAYRRVAA